MSCLSVPFNMKTWQHLMASVSDPVCPGYYSFKLSCLFAIEGYYTEAWKWHFGGNFVWNFIQIRMELCTKFCTKGHFWGYFVRKPSHLGPNGPNIRRNFTNYLRMKLSRKCHFQAFVLLCQVCPIHRVLPGSQLLVLPGFAIVTWEFGVPLMENFIPASMVWDAIASKHD